MNLILQLLKDIFLMVFRNVCKSRKSNFLQQNQLLSFIHLQEKFGVNAVARIIAEKQRQQVLVRYVLHTIPRAKNTALQQNKFLKMRSFTFVVSCLEFLNLMQIFLKIKFVYHSDAPSMVLNRL